MSAKFDENWLVFETLNHGGKEEGTFFPVEDSVISAMSLSACQRRYTGRTFWRPVLLLLRHTWYRFQYVWFLGSATRFAGRTWFRVDFVVVTPLGLSQQQGEEQGDKIIQAATRKRRTQTLILLYVLGKSAYSPRLVNPESIDHYYDDSY